MKTISKESIAIDASKKEHQAEQDFHKEKEREEVKKKVHYCDLSGVPI